jgi:hypothetical protein
VVDYARVVKMNQTDDAVGLKEDLPLPDFFTLLADQALAPDPFDGATAKLSDDSLDRRVLPTLVNVPDEKARRRIEALVAYRRKHCDLALRLLESLGVEGDRPLGMVLEECSRAVGKQPP